MVNRKGKQLMEKHRSGVKPDSKIKNAVLKHAPNSELPCAVAFEIAKELGVSPSEVGISADLINVKLIQCQLGLFGYKPKKKIVKPQAKINQDITDAVREQLVGGKLSCKSSWDIAARFKVSRMTISEVCEAMNIKIKACQLGAF